MPIVPASVKWGSNHEVHSLLYDDIYFSTDAPQEESRYVFLEGNHLDQRWKENTYDSFVIAETGFGTGLNFLLTWNLWQQHPSCPETLHFFSFEKHPLPLEILKKIHTPWDSLKPLWQLLHSQYPPLANGWHTLVFEEGKVLLTLVFGDCSEQLSELEASVDAWYLDGFAPAKNPEMWTPQVMSHVFEKTTHNGTFATFTAAGAIRRSLQTVGFDVAKRKGFGKKRESLIGIRTESDATLTLQCAHKKPWFSLPKTRIPPHPRIAVIGAGIAGCSVANRLSAYGQEVCVIEKSKVAEGASGNEQGLILPALTADPDEFHQFYRQGFFRMKQYLRQMQMRLSSEGVMQFAFSDKLEKRFQQIIEKQLFPEGFLEWKTSKQASELLQTPVEFGGVWIPGAGSLSPKQVCIQQLASPLISLKENTPVQSLKRLKKGWELYDAQHNTLGVYDIVVIANAWNALQFDETQGFPLQPVRGQVSLISQEALNHCPAHALGGKGYLIPLHQSDNADFLLGASFIPADTDLEPRDAEHDENAEYLRQLSPDAFKSTDVTEWNARVSIRCASKDHLPLVGPVPQKEFMQTHYATVKHGRTQETFPTVDYHEGLYLSVGHGSRGLVSAVLSADILASYILNKPSWVPQRLRHALHPGRFWIKDLIRGK